MMIRRRTCLSIVGAGVLVLTAHSRCQADPPAAPAVSTFAPTDDLLSLVNQHIAQCEKALADPTDWDAQSRVVKRDANTLVVIAQALALHDEDHQLKAGGSGLYAATQQLAAALDHATAQQALSQVKAAAGGEATGANTTGAADVSWTAKSASLGPLMKQVTFQFNRLKRNTRGDRLAKQAAETTCGATLLAVIAQAVQADTHEVKDPADTDKWYQLTAAMRDASAQLRSTIATGDAAATAESLAALDKTCKSCHEVFRIKTP